MEYKIKKGDKFLCLEDYEMYDDESLAYTKGETYLSEVDGCITDNELDVNHKMNNQYDFFKYFQVIYQES